MLLRVVRFVERLQRYINARTLKAARSCAAAQHGSSGGGSLQSHFTGPCNLLGC